jgi:putative membrane protein
VLAFALIAATVAALIHVYIFVLESLLWTREATRRTFGVATLSEAETTKALAFNQGFYNLFLAVIALLGVIFTLVGATEIGAALLFSSAGSMVLAGLVLLVSSPSKARAALIQLGAPLLAVVALALSLLF